MITCVTPRIKQNTAIMIFLLFSLNGNICILERIKSDKNEPSVTDGLLRSALDFAFRRGVDTAVCSLFEFSDELISLGFTQKDEVFSGNTAELLQGSCCKH